MVDLLEKVTIVQIADDKIVEQEDVVVKETPLTIFINDEELVTLLCLPQHQQNLAVGFLFSEGILSSWSCSAPRLMTKNPTRITSAG